MKRSLTLNKRAPIGVEVLCYSPITQRWTTAFNTNGTVEGLIQRDHFDNKLDALLDLKRALEFREGLVANCEPICHMIDNVNQQIKAIQLKRTKGRAT